MTFDFIPVLCLKFATQLNSPENIFVTRTSESSHFYADPSLEKKTAGTCDLFIVVEKNAVQMALKERRSGSLLAFELIPAKDKKESWKDLLENVSAQSKVLRNYEFLKVTACIMSPEFTLVPEALFKAGDEEIYFRKNYPVSENLTIRAQHVQSFKLNIVFGIEKDLEKELNHLFQDPQLFHLSQALLAGISMQLKVEAGKQLWLNIRRNKIDIIVSENRKLLLINSYSWQTNEDILYFTLFVCEQLELNPEKFPLTVTGEIENNSALQRLLENYIKSVRIPERPASLAFVLDVDVPFHYYAMLYNLSLCE